jgi:hypothetical protein
MSIDSSRALTRVGMSREQERIPPGQPIQLEAGVNLPNKNDFIMTSAIIPSQLEIQHGHATRDQECR